MMFYEAPYTLERKTRGAAAFDIAAVGLHTIPVRANVVVSTGLKLHIPVGWYGMVTMRSGHGFNKDLVCHIGIIDSDYRGEVKVKVFNLGQSPVTIADGERFAQLTIHPIAPIFPWQVEHVDANTERGENGFGSTGEKV